EGGGTSSSGLQIPVPPQTRRSQSCGCCNGMAIAVSAQKVLVVDDEDHILELARLYLSREGYQIETVADGAQALARFGQVKPDLVVLDVMLPNVDGLTICKEIR